MLEFGHTRGYQDVCGNQAGREKCYFVNVHLEALVLPRKQSDTVIYLPALFLVVINVASPDPFELEKAVKSSEGEREAKERHKDPMNVDVRQLLEEPLFAHVVSIIEHY